MFNLKDVRNLDRDDLLHLIGLEQRRTATDWLLPAVGLFSVGFLVGTGIGLMLAPKPGRELREELKTRLQGGAGPLAEQYPSAPGVAEKGQPRPL